MFNRGNFWRNVALIGLAHVVAVIGLIRWNASANSAKPENIVWVTGESAGGGDGPPRISAAASTPLPAVAEPSATPIETTDEPEPILTAAKSDIELPAATPTTTPTPVAKPEATPLLKTPPKPSPHPPRKPRPKPSPRPTPKPTPKPKPQKMILAKAAPHPTTREENDEDADTPNPDSSPTPAVEKNRTADNETENAGSSATAIKTAPGSGGTGHGKGDAKSSELAAYSRMLHDRLYSEWDQPTSTVSTAAKISTVVRVRIEKNGRISHFEIIKPSGNVMIDESVEAIGKHVSQVDPLPPSLRGRSGHYDIKINFELNSE